MIGTVYLVMALLTVGILVYFACSLRLWEIFEDSFKNPQPEVTFETKIYSPEDVAIAEFLEVRQAITEDFLVCQKALLEELKRTYR